MRTRWTPAKSRTILRVWAVPGMAQGVRRRPLPPSKSGRRRIVLSRSSVPPPIPLSGPRDRWPRAGCPLWISSPPPPDSSPVAATGYLPTAPPRNASNRQTGGGRLTAPTGQNDQLSALLDDHRQPPARTLDQARNGGERDENAQDRSAGRANGRVIDAHLIGHRLESDRRWMGTRDATCEFGWIAMEELTRDAVLKAIGDFDDRGPDEFFQHYGVRRARSYFIRHDGQDYDMKAITRVALGLVLGRPAVRAPVGHAAAVKRKLANDFDFEVIHHVDTYDRTSQEGRRYWTKQRQTERDPRLAGEAMRLNRRRHAGWIKCEACGLKDKERSMFDAHHLSPLSLGKRRSCQSDLVVLCPTCHRWAHAKAGDRLHPLPVEQIRRARRRTGRRSRR